MPLKNSKYGTKEAPAYIPAPKVIDGNIATKTKIIVVPVPTATDQVLDRKWTAEFKDGKEHTISKIKLNVPEEPTTLSVYVGDTKCGDLDARNARM